MKIFRFVSLGVLIAGIAAVLFAFVHLSRRPDIDMEADPGPTLIKPFTLVDQSSKTVTLADLKGKVWVADFIFTRCMGPCPTLTRRMKTITEEFNSADLRFVSITVDPAYDRPDVLKAYAEERAGDPRWMFLTGEPKDVEKLIRESFALALDPGAATNGVPDITHSTRFAIVDREGRLVGTFDTSDVDGMRGIRDELRRLKT